MDKSSKNVGNDAAPAFRYFLSRYYKSEFYIVYNENEYLRINLPAHEWRRYNNWKVLAKKKWIEEDLREMTKDEFLDELTAAFVDYMGIDIENV